MSKLSKRMKAVKSEVGEDTAKDFSQAIEVLKKVSKVKFDETVEVYFHLNVDPRKADQMVRGVVRLPHGTGKKVKVLVFANEAKEKEALDAGADYAGFGEYYEKVKSGWLDFDVLIVTPDLMKEVGKLGRILGPKGLMPSPKSGTVTQDVSKAVSEVKKGKIEYRVDKHGNIAVGIGKISFAVNQLKENAQSVYDEILRAKPATVKGDYIKSSFMSSTMGPSIPLEL